jgi:prepilin-type N-terminal cleavage/methylation domain-containing protein
MKIKVQAGFTLVEILIAIGILGIVMAAVYSVYFTNQRSAYTQEEVVDVQQNLRMALERISADVRMAGMLVPVTTASVGAGFSNYSTSISLNTASAGGIYARITAAPTIVAGTDSVACTVESADAVDMLEANQAVAARVIRPADCNQPISATFTLKAFDRTVPSITIQNNAGNFAVGDVIKRGDMIALTDTTPDPNTVAYSVITGGTCPANQKCLSRKVNGTSEEIVANYISDLKFAYILDDSSETNNPTDTSKIRAVRVTLTGQTTSTAVLSGGPKTRELSSVIKIRNRRL